MNINPSGEELKQQGMRVALEHADSSTDWSSRAWKALVSFLNSITPDTKFMGEDIRDYAESKRNLERPPSNRAWGSLIIRAKKMGIIKHVGYSQVNNPLAHKANASVWMKV